jgi:pimeloyl-ACP methyl ester carboxylesterase
MARPTGAATTSFVTSADGTRIGVSRVGSGPAIVLIDGAMCFRGAGPMQAVAADLADRFIAVTYDRRGRGESSDTAPYAVEREIEDLAAVIAWVGGPVALYAMSSGGALALRAAAAGLPVSALVLYEPPFSEAVDQGAVAYTEALGRALAAGRPGDAVGAFLSRVGVPVQGIEGMRRSPGWPAMEAIAPTLAHDDAQLAGGLVPYEIAGRVRVPTLVAAGGASPAFLIDGAKATAAAIIGGQFELLPGQTHDVAPAAIAACLVEFLAN